MELNRFMLSILSVITILGGLAWGSPAFAINYNEYLKNKNNFIEFNPGMTWRESTYVSSVNGVETERRTSRTTDIFLGQGTSGHSSGYRSHMENAPLERDQLTLPDDLVKAFEKFVAETLKTTIRFKKVDGKIVASIFDNLQVKDVELDTGSDTIEESMMKILSSMDIRNYIQKMTTASFGYQNPHISDSKAPRLMSKDRYSQMYFFQDAEAASAAN